jgi:hypothetical protein
MADPAKYKSLSVPKDDWEQLGVTCNIKQIGPDLK